MKRLTYYTGGAKGTSWDAGCEAGVEAKNAEWKSTQNPRGVS